MKLLVLLENILFYYLQYIIFKPHYNKLVILFKRNDYINIKGFF